MLGQGLPSLRGGIFMDNVKSVKNYTNSYTESINYQTFREGLLIMVEGVVLTTEEADDFIQKDKIIIDNIIWIPDGQHLQFEVDVFCLDGATGLTLKGSISVTSKSRKLPNLSLMHRKKHPLRMLHWKNHHNPECDIVNAPHKNYWTTEYKWKKAYHVEEINDGMSSAEIVLGFLAECNIELKGSITDTIFGY